MILDDAIAEAKSIVLGLRVAADAENRLIKAYADVQEAWDKRTAEGSSPFTVTPEMSRQMRVKLDATNNARRYTREADAIERLLSVVSS